MFTKRIRELCERMRAHNIDVALITNEDSVYYFSGYYDYLHMEFGRPTILVVWQRQETLLITPSIDLNTAHDTAHVDRIESWNDGIGNEWREHLPVSLRGQQTLAIETLKMPATVQKYLYELRPDQKPVDIDDLISEMRMIKSDEELQLARHAGIVASDMMQAGREAIADGVPEYEVALATTAAGTRTAARLLREHYPPGAMSPNIHFLQIMASGPEITRTHHRATNRIMAHGDPVFLCFCGMTNFHRFKLGFDRTFWIGEITDPAQASIYQVALESQAAAVTLLKPGAIAEEIHAAYAEVIQSAGYEFPFRCGRGTGFSFLEKPQLVSGDKTILKTGMVLAVDGSVSAEHFRAQVGDSFILTDDGAEQLTHHPKSIDDVVIGVGPQ